MPRHFTKAGTKYCLSNGRRYSVQRSFLSLTDGSFFLSPRFSLSLSLSISLKRSERYENACAYNERTGEQPGVVTTARNLMRIGSIPYIYITVRARTRALRFINKMNTPTFGVTSPSKIEIRARRARERKYLFAYIILNVILYEEQ